ncbi:hypothetical protein HDU97_003186 [Phlyctochytrium planicorne]|nr:hypothetical protein HDU97_003186 [Phlyctochytrium planicorne]
MDFFSSLLGSTPGKQGTHKQTASVLPSSSAVLSQIGPPGRHPTSTCFAHDPAQSFIAVGLSDGSILMVGSPPNFETILPPPVEATRGSPVKHIKFKVGDRYLISVNNHNEIVVWNLATSTIQFPPIPVGVPVTSLCVPSGSSGWFYVGVATGQTLVYDALRGIKSQYHIPCLLDQLSPENKDGSIPVAITDAANEPINVTEDSPSRIVALETCPTDFNQIMIAHASGIIFLWDLKAKALLKRFCLPSTSTQAILPVNSATWRPDGTQIVSSHSHLLAFWTVKEAGFLHGLKTLAGGDNELSKKPSCLRNLDAVVDAEHDAERLPIFKLAWFYRPQQDISQTMLMVSGGTRTVEPHGITLFEFGSKDVKLAKPYALFALESGVLDFVPLTLWDAQPPAFGVLVSTTANELKAFNCEAHNFTPLSLTPSIDMLSSADILSFTMLQSSQMFLDRLKPFMDQRAPPVPLRGGSADMMPYSTSKSSHKSTSNDLLLTVHADSTVKFWHHDTAAPSASPLPTLLYSLDVKGLINISKGTTTAPSHTWMHFDQREGSLILSSGAVVLVLKYEGSSGLGSFSPSGSEENREYTDEDVDKMMKELDDTIDGVLQDLTDQKGSPIHVAGAQEQAGAETSDENEAKLAINEQPNPSISAPVTVDKLDASSPEQNHGPKLPPRPEAGPPLPPRAENNSTSSLVSPQTSEDTPYSDMVSNTTVVIDRIGRRRPPRIKGWAPYVSAIYMNNVASVAFAGWLNILASTTVDGILTISDISTGKTLMTDTFKESPDSLPIEIVLLHFAETYFDKESEIRPTLFVATADGALYAYGLSEWSATTPRHVLRRITVIKPSSVFVDDPSHLASYNRPLLVQVLDENGVPVTQQLVKSNENYLVFTGSRSATVLLLEPLKPPQLISERTFSAAMSNPLANFIGQKRASPGMYVVQAGLALVRSGPIVLAVTRDGAISGYTLPSLDMAFDTHSHDQGKPSVHQPDSLGLSTAWGLSPARVQILTDGRICCWTGEKELKIMAGISDEIKYKSRPPKLYDVIRQSAWAKSTGRSPALSAQHTKEADELFEGRRYKDDSSQQKSPGRSSSSQASDLSHHPMSEAREKLNERGERLQDLEGKFASLADSSKTMVDMIKEYNERQEKKKWWEL